MTGSTPILALFPGQGSQTVGMGKELAEKSSVAKEIFERADSALGFSLSTVCFDGPADKLTATEIAQPAILTVSTICYELAKSRFGANLVVAAAAGHSLGEYSALVAARSISFEDAVVLVHKRGKYMQSAVPAGVGKMVAVLSKEVAEIEAALEKVSDQSAEIANINAPGQIVVSGKREGVDEFVQHLGAGRVIELQVSAPFHCSLMEPAAQSLAKDLDQTKIKDPTFPVFANFLAAPVRTADEIRTALKKQVCGRVRWVESMQNAIASTGVSQAIEFGAGNVLCGLLRRIDPKIARIECGSLEAVEKLFG